MSFHFKCKYQIRICILIRIRANGTTFTAVVDCDASDIARFPKKGDVVTFDFFKFSNLGRPVSARIVKIREDVTWEKVLYDFEHHIPHPQTESCIPLWLICATF